MITRLTIKGYKTLRDLTLDLAPVTVLLGANNVGKTNVVRAIELLARALQLGSLVRATQEETPDILTRGGDGVLSFRVEGVIDGHSFVYELGSDDREKLDVQGTFGCSTGRINGTFGDPFGTGTKYGGEPGSGLASLRQARTTPAPIKKIASFLSGMVAADFSAGRLREPSLPAPDVTLGREGENLAAVLDRLQGERPLVRRRIDEEVHRAVPSIDLVTTIAQDAGKKIVGVAEGDSVFRADHISDGILLFIALSTIAQMNGGASLVALEEIERGIHPRRIRETLDQVFRVARSGTQFLLTTHSPVLLNEFRDHTDAVIVLERDERGTTARRLSDLTELERELKDVSLGDLWFSGVLGGVPAQ